MSVCTCRPTAACVRGTVLVLCVLAQLGGLEHSVAAQAMATVTGSIMDRATRRPIQNGIVVLEPIRGGVLNSRQLNATRRVVTDAAGRFVFLEVGSGRYVLRAGAPGYIPATYGGSEPDDTEAILNVNDRDLPPTAVIGLWPTSSIGGAVYEEGGRPAVGVKVVGLRRLWMIGGVRMITTATTRTDDQGAFELDGLLPGTYVVAAVFTPHTVPITIIRALDARDPQESARRTHDPGLGDFRSVLDAARHGDAGGAAAVIVGQASGQLVTVDAAQAAPAQSLANTYYPASASVTGASALSVEAGERLTGLVMQVRRVVTGVVRGTLVGPGAAGALVRAAELREGQAGTNPEVDAGVALSDDAGRFELVGIPPGRYLVTANSTQVNGVFAAEAPSVSWGATTVDTEGASSDVGAVQMRPAVLCAGVLRMENGGSPLPPQLGVRLLRTDSGPSVSAAFPVSPSGEFETGPLLGGEYYLDITGLPPGVAVESAVVNGKEISADAFSSEDVASGRVSITLTDRPSILYGQIRGSGAPGTTRSVLVFPADPQLRNTLSPRRVRVLTPGDGSKFVVTGLTDGSYCVAVTSMRVSDQAGDPDVLAKLSRQAIKVTLVAGRTTTVSVDAVP